MASLSFMTQMTQFDSELVSIDKWRKHCLTLVTYIDSTSEAGERLCFPVNIVTVQIGQK